MSTVIEFLRRQGIALLALFVAIGGTSYAAVSIGKGEVGKRELANNAVTTKKVKDGSLVSGDFGKGQLPQGEKGPQGERGLQGVQGVAGSSRAWATVTGAGIITNSFNITSVVRINAGSYCITVGGGITPANSALVASVNYNDPTTVPGDQLEVDSNYTGVCTTSQWGIHTRPAGGAGLNDAGFTIAVP